MHPEQIKAAIRMKKEDFQTIAAACAVSNTTVSHVVHGRGTSSPVAKHISKITGLSIATLFPGKYTKPPKARAKQAA